MSRYLVWFSAGAASAVTAKLALAEHGDAVTLAYTDPGSEHPDNERFITDCEAWFDAPVMRLSSPKYRDTWQVWTERRFLNGPVGALCTTELKKKVRWAIERDYDVQAFGYTAEEQHRADRFRQQNPDVRLWTPLIERGLVKKDCLAIIERAGIELPAMYLLGYANNNCIGCVKGGAGYWNKIRRDFPDVFDRMAALEQDIGATCLREADPANPGKKRPLPLLTLDPKRGRYSDEPDIECSLLCSATSDEIGGDGARPAA